MLLFDVDRMEPNQISKGRNDHLVYFRIDFRVVYRQPQPNFDKFKCFFPFPNHKMWAFQQKI